MRTKFHEDLIAFHDDFADRLSEFVQAEHSRREALKRALPVALAHQAKLEREACAKEVDAEIASAKLRVKDPEALRAVVQFLGYAAKHIRERE